VSPQHLAALRHAALGHRVFPCHGKLPRTPHGFLDASADPAQVTTWWERWPDANIGLTTGSAARLVVLDVDGEAGRTALRGRTIPVTQVVETARGWHYYFAYPDRPVRSRVGVLEHVDVRADGGYVIAAGSVHESGAVYRYADGLGPRDVELAPCPSWLLGVAGASAPPRAPEEWAALIRDGVAAGARNATMASLAGHLFRRFVDGGVVLELLRAWNDARCRPPLDDDEVVRTVESVAGAELRRRQAAQ
jgi:hypothetical protein